MFGTEFRDNMPKTELHEKIMYFKIKLAKTDYQAIKYAEGKLTIEEYAPMMAQRDEWRANINRLEAELEALKAEEV